MILKQCPLYSGVILLIAACSSPELNKISGFTQGTTYQITYWTTETKEHKKLKTLIQKELQRIDEELSNYRPDSTIEGFNQQNSTEKYYVGTEIANLIKTAKKVNKLSLGCYDLTIKPLFDLWGFQGETLTVPTEATISKSRQQMGMSKINIFEKNLAQKKHPKLQLDLSSIAQGYSVEKISQILEQQGLDNYLVEIGGELKAHGHKPNQQSWRVAIEQPLPGARVLHKIITIANEQSLAVMTSGTYRHYFDNHGKRYSHILDARTGRPVEHDLVSVTVINKDPIIADAWSTALLCMGQEAGLKLANQQDIAALFIQQQDKTLVESQTLALQTTELAKLE
ncbi:MAG: FAD:protein FMN transferase [Methylococcaceae bacterium]